MVIVPATLMIEDLRFAFHDNEKTITTQTMIKNYFKTTWRNLVSNKAFSLINISGLSLGMICSLLITLWLKDELLMDRFHANDKRLYRVMENQHYSGSISTLPSTPGILAENIVKDIPEIKMAS